MQFSLLFLMPSYLLQFCSSHYHMSLKDFLFSSYLLKLVSWHLRQPCVWSLSCYIHPWTHRQFLSSDEVRPYVRKMIIGDAVCLQSVVQQVRLSADSSWIFSAHLDFTMTAYSPPVYWLNRFLFQNLERSSSRSYYWKLSLGKVLVNEEINNIEKQNACLKIKTSIQN